jgi:hypothetical protein
VSRSSNKASSKKGSKKKQKEVADKKRSIGRPSEIQ